MDNKKQKNAVTNEIGTSEELITRNEAVKKVAKYMAITALSTFIILSPKKAQAESPSAPGGFNGG